MHALFVQSPHPHPPSSLLLLSPSSPPLRLSSFTDRHSVHLPVTAAASRPPLDGPSPGFRFSFFLSLSLSLSRFSAGYTRSWTLPTYHIHYQSRIPGHMRSWTLARRPYFTSLGVSYVLVLYALMDAVPYMVPVFHMYWYYTRSWTLYRTWFRFLFFFSPPLDRGPRGAMDQDAMD